MICITLPDGTDKEFDSPVSLAQVAAAIGPGLAKAALAGVIDGQLADLDTVMEKDAKISLITGKSPEALEIIRHSTSHLMAQAVKSLFPGAQVTIGPSVENGFYYDFDYERPFTLEDLASIEKKMEALVKENFTIQRRVMDRDEAVAFFKAMGEE